VNAGIEALATRHGATLVRLQPEWYGRDPIHMLPRHWTRAWQSILLAGSRALAPPKVTPSPSQWLHLYRARPELRWLLGREQRRSQPAVCLPDGTTVWIY